MSRNLKNVLVVSVGFVLMFTAYGGLLSLQSSLNAEEGMGVVSLSVIYASSILSCMFLSPIIIKNLGCKWTIVASMTCYVAYYAGNLYPGWGTLIPTSILLGLGGSPMWSAKCAYLTISANQQAGKDNKRSQDVITLYFGIFFLIFQSYGVWGNLMSSLIFGQDPNIANITEENLKFCGAGVCTQNITGESPRPEKKLVNILVGCYIGVGLLAIVLVALFLDNIDGDTTRKFRKNREPFWSTFLATFRQLRDKRQLALIPLTMYSGFEQGFVNGDYTKYYVTCALGIHFVGYVMICYGAISSIFSLTYGRLAKYTGRAPLYGFAAVMNFSCIIALLFWKPHPDQLPVFFVFSALLGMVDAGWITQTNALYGVLFPLHKEAAFSNYRLWECMGFMIAFAYSGFICLDYKLYILIAVLVLSMALYAWVEWGERKSPTPRVDPNHDVTEKGEGVDQSLEQSANDKYQS